MLSKSSIGPAEITAGLILLLFSLQWPNWPAVSGMALIAAGSGQTLNLRPRPAVTILMHLAIYLLLFCLYIGARVHQVSTGDVSGVCIWLDIVLGTLVFCPVCAAGVESARNAERFI
jgi:hypothetical protein